MSFSEVVRSFNRKELSNALQNTTATEVEQVLGKDVIVLEDYLKLLSPAAEVYLEQMAERAHDETVRNFGYTMQLFTPMYIANYCDNGCVYCGYNHGSGIHREKLTIEEIRTEGENIAKTGLKHVLLLTGESQKFSPVSYIKEAVQALKSIFPSVSIEVYSLTRDEYAELAEAGVDGMTMFQETYDEDVYTTLHPFGPKSDFAYRLDTPEAACRGGLRTVNIGALLGLSGWREEAFLTGLHASYLQSKYRDVEVAISTPRIRPCAVGFQPKHIVEDRHIVQYITAFRLFMPRSGITVSSRENQTMRNSLLPLGVTKMSAGVTTAVGGHTHKEDTGQFDISDSRSVSEMAAMISKEGYRPIYKDWQVLV